MAWSEKVDIAVAFVRKSGVTPLEQEICHLLKNGGQIRILTGMDFGFTEPEALIALQKLGVQVRVFSANRIFHPKCYLFQKESNLKVVIGSSNLTSSGLETGVEWNVFLDSTQEKLHELSLSFERLWNSKYAKQLSEEVLKELQIIQKESQNEKVKNKLLGKLDYAAESIQFLFNVGKSFLDYAHHPITIPKNRWNDKLRQIKTSHNCEIIIDSANRKKYQGNIYTSEAGFGQFYQLRFDTHTSREISSLFKLSSLINVQIKFYDGLIQVNLDKVA